MPPRPWQNTTTGRPPPAAPSLAEVSAVRRAREPFVSPRVVAGAAVAAATGASSTALTDMSSRCEKSTLLTLPKAASPRATAKAWCASESRRQKTQKQEPKVCPG